MLHSHKLLDADRERIEREIANLLGMPHPSAALRLSRVDTKTEPAPASKLLDSFAVWELPAAAIGPFSGRLNLVARPTGRIHHQVASADGAVATHIAQSAVSSEDGHHLLRAQSVIRSNIGAQLNEALAFADREIGHDGRDYRAHLLIVPSRLLHALWLEGLDDDKIVVVDMPERTNGLERRRIYAGPEFMDKIAKTETVGLGRSVADRPSPNRFVRLFSSQPTGPSGGTRVRRTIDDIRRFFIFFLFGNVLWIFIVAIASGTYFGFLQILGICGLLSGAALIVGVLFGFIFGIPRSLASTSAAVAQQVVVGHESDASQLNVLANTNLEQISDWLTKVLVGVGLTQLTQIVPRISAAHDALENWLGITHGGVIGLAIVTAFGCGGFVWAYFESRTSLMKVFSDDDPRGSADQPSVQQHSLNALAPPSARPSTPGMPAQTVDTPPPIPPTPPAQTA